MLVQRRRTGGGLVHEDDGGVGHQLHCDGEALALLHAEARFTGGADQRVAQGSELHQLHHLLSPNACHIIPGRQGEFAAMSEALAQRSNSLVLLPQKVSTAFGTNTSMAKSQQTDFLIEGLVSVGRYCLHRLSFR